MLIYTFMCVIVQFVPEASPVKFHPPQLRTLVPRMPAAAAGVEGLCGLGGGHGGQHSQGGRDGSAR